jgi:hypothetical protein
MQKRPLPSGSVKTLTGKGLSNALGTMYNGSWEASQNYECPALTAELAPRHHKNITASNVLQLTPKWLFPETGQRSYRSHSTFLIAPTPSTDTTDPRDVRQSFTSAMPTLEA